MSNSKKSKRERTPQKISPEEWRDKRRQQLIAKFKLARKALATTTKEATKYVKKKMFAPTLGAREKAERPAYRHVRIEKRIKKKIEAIRLKFEENLLSMFTTKKLSLEEYTALTRKIDNLVKRHEREASLYAQGIVYSVKALAGVDRRISITDYAVFDSLLDNIDKLYGKDVKIAQIFIAIQKDMLSDKQWGAICKYVRKYRYQRDVSKDRDEINLNITGFFVSIMNPTQRYQLVLEFHKRYGRRSNRETINLIDALTSAGVLNIKQREELIRQITGNKKYRMSQTELRSFARKQRNTRKLLAGVSSTLNKPLYINGAERILNRRTLAGAVIAGIGILGMVSNYLSHLNSAKGMGRLVAGFKSPYFLASAAVAAGGYHIAGTGVRAGKSPGFLEKWILKPRRIDNPFGTGKGAEKRDRYFTVLSQLCANNRDIESWLLNKRGFNDLWKFYTKKRYDHLNSQAWIEKRRRELKKKKKKGEKIKRYSLVDDFVDFQERRGKGWGNNRDGARMLEKITKNNGKRNTTTILIQLLAITHELGIKSSRDFKNKARTVKGYSLFQLLLDRQGVKSLKKQRPKIKVK